MLLVIDSLLCHVLPLKLSFVYVLGQVQLHEAEQNISYTIELWAIVPLEVILGYMHIHIYI